MHAIVRRMREFCAAAGFHDELHIPSGHIRHAAFRLQASSKDLADFTVANDADLAEIHDALHFIQIALNRSC